MRASGAFAPVLIKAGALNNVNDLVLGPEHRLFIYQRSDELGTGRSETLVRVRHLVNGNDVRRIEAAISITIKSCLTNTSSFMPKVYRLKVSFWTSIPCSHFQKKLRWD